MNRFKFFLLFIGSFPILAFAQQTVGLFQNTITTYPGYTLFAPLQSDMTYLIDNCGLLVHSWESTVRPGSAVYLLEDGSLLRAERLDTPFFNSGGKGGRIVRLDWDGNLMWQYDIADEFQQQHHDIEFLPNGNILAIVWELREEAEIIAAGRDPNTFGSTLWVDKIIELAPIDSNQAQVVWEWRLWDHLVQEFDSTKANYGIVREHPELMDFNFVGEVNAGPGGITDWSHFNAIDYNEELDQIILSSRHFSEFWIIDHSTSTEQAAGHTGGNSGKGGDILYRWGNPVAYNRGTELSQQLFFQHDAQWIAPGLVDENKIMVFNNGLDRPGGSFSSIDIIDPPLNNEGQYIIDELEAYGPSGTSWSYDGQPDNGFYSINISGAQRLPNGNTLICVGSRGWFMEVQDDGGIAWEYVNPVNNNGPVTQGNNTGSNSVFRATRYGLDYPGLAGRDLSPGDPLELEPLPSNCVTDTEEAIIPTVNIYPNPVQNWLQLDSPQWMNTSIRVLNTFGQELMQYPWEGYMQRINIAALPKGLYFVQIGTREVHQVIKL